MDRTKIALEYVQGLRGHWTWLSAHTGLNPHWIAKFGQKVIENPQAWRVDKILEFKAQRKRPPK